jgi:ribA/ribD-fused uncharacterized protein
MAINDFHGRYFFLSNFSEHPFWYNGRQWKTVEHAFQAAKCMNGSDYDKIHQAATPGEAKRLGRRCTLIPNWDNIRIDIMRECLLMKFLCNDELLSQLMSTGDEELVEGNTWNDTFWGRVKKGDGSWKGNNMLGKLLMEIRENCREGNYCWIAVDRFEDNGVKNNATILRVFKNRTHAMEFIAEQTTDKINPFEAGAYRIKPILFG